MLDVASPDSNTARVTQLGNQTPQGQNSSPVKRRDKSMPYAHVVQAVTKILPYAYVDIITCSSCYCWEPVRDARSGKSPHRLSTKTKSYSTTVRREVNLVKLTLLSQSKRSTAQILFILSALTTGLALAIASCPAAL